MTHILTARSPQGERTTRTIARAVLAVVALAAPSAAAAVDAPSYDVASPRATERPVTAEALKQVEIGQSISDPGKYLAFVKSLADYDNARHYGDKR